jgi:hypothetical protein
MSPPARSLDHFVIAVRDVEAAGSTYEKLGFHTLPRARHIEIGTSNRVIQLHDTYLELIDDLDKSPPLLRERMIPRFECGEGLAIVSLTSADLPADHRRISQSHFPPDRILNARRKIVLPSGAEDETDSSCFYVWRDGRIYATLFFSEHRRPETIWVAEYQRHANTVRRVTSLIYLSDDPPSEVDYVRYLLGAGPSRVSPDYVRFDTPRGESLEFLSHGELSARFGDLAPAPCASQPVLGVGLSLEVTDLEACRSLLARTAGSAAALRDAIVVPAAHACGVLLEFHAATRGATSVANSVSERSASS